MEFHVSDCGIPFHHRVARHRARSAIVTKTFFSSLLSDTFFSHIIYVSFGTSSSPLLPSSDRRAAGFGLDLMMMMRNEEAIEERIERKIPVKLCFFFSILYAAGWGEGARDRKLFFHILFLFSGEIRIFFKRERLFEHKKAIKISLLHSNKI